MFPVRRFQKRAKNSNFVDHQLLTPAASHKVTRIAENYLIISLLNIVLKIVTIFGLKLSALSYNFLTVHFVVILMEWVSLIWTFYYAVAHGGRRFSTNRQRK
jgi:NADH:ubiquinone oxidoreductase subunit 3 (subunit A)